jgi:hypothetical protein
LQTFRTDVNRVLSFWRAISIKLFEEIFDLSEKALHSQSPYLRKVSPIKLELEFEKAADNYAKTLIPKPKGSC